MRNYYLQFQSGGTTLLESAKLGGLAEKTAAAFQAEVQARFKAQMEQMQAGGMPKGLPGVLNPRPAPLGFSSEGETFPTHSGP